MNRKELFKRFQRAMARYAFHGTSWLIAHLPYRCVRGIMHFFVAVGFRTVIRQRRLAEESLQTAFGNEKSPEEVKQITRACFENIGQAMMELMYFMAHPRMLREQVSFEGEARKTLDDVLRQGKGVILVSAHFGSFPLMLLKLAQEGYKINAIIRPARDKKMERHFVKQRGDLGLNTIYALPRKQCVDMSIKALRNNELLFIPLDQNFGSGRGVYVDFFGRKAATATGPIVFSQRTGAPILPVFIIRDKGDRYKILVEPPMEIERSGDDKETVQFNVARITRLIEQYIREYPHEWGWMHRRWKTQPPPK